MGAFIIAEAGVNHNGDLAMAKRLIDVAAEAQADAVKFQTFRAASLVTGFAPKAEYQYDIGGAKRLDEELMLELPDYFAGDEVHVYLGMVSKTGGIACNSLYLGTVVVDENPATEPEEEPED